MWSIRNRNWFFTVACGCWCFQLVKAQQSKHIDTPEVLLCDELCEFSAWAMHAYCGERMLGDLPLQCREVKTLDVRLNDIHSLKSGRLSEFDNLKYLFLVGNNMSEVEDGAFEGCEGIQFLSWGGNNFTRLTRSKFVGLRNLMHMLMDNSNIREIETEAFIETPLLKTLDLTGNKFISPPCDVVHPQNVLTDLSLSDNFISILPEGCFSRFQNLERLKLSNNPIRLITNLSTFEGLHSLKKLEMDNTSLTSLPVGSFRHIHTVNEFVLSRNLIKVLEERDFATLPEVEVLRLDHNHIHAIHSRTFVDLQSLRLLVISNNKIMSIGLHAFIPVETTLEELYLDGNELRSIHNISASSIRSLKNLSLARNPLECHCHLSTFRHSTSGMEQGGASATCRKSNGVEVNIFETTLTATPCPKPTPGPVNPRARIGPTNKPTMPIYGETTEQLETNELSTSQQNIFYVLIFLMVLTVMLGCALLVWWILRVKMRKNRKYSKPVEDNNNVKDKSDNYDVI
eukprot:XP_011675645.1 PREDICTED: chondroadherin-like [Strongylocentrotus purpuratus]